MAPIAAVVDVEGAPAMLQPPEERAVGGRHARETRQLPEGDHRAPRGFVENAAQGHGVVQHVKLRLQHPYRRPARSARERGAREVHARRTRLKLRLLGRCVVHRVDFDDAGSGAREAHVQLAGAVAQILDRRRAHLDLAPVAIEAELDALPRDERQHDSPYHDASARDHERRTSEGMLNHQLDLPGRRRRRGARSGRGDS